MQEYIIWFFFLYGAKVGVGVRKYLPSRNRGQGTNVNSTPSIICDYLNVMKPFQKPNARHQILEILPYGQDWVIGTVPVNQKTNLNEAQN